MVCSRRNLDVSMKTWEVGVSFCTPMGLNLLRMEPSRGSTSLYSPPMKVLGVMKATKGSEGLYQKDEVEL